MPVDATTATFYTDINLQAKTQGFDSATLKRDQFNNNYFGISSTTFQKQNMDKETLNYVMFCHN